jgi:ABC-type nitrate/sulfonate/bicarbonate transport system substrate-binding protein
MRTIADAQKTTIGRRATLVFCCMRAAMRTLVLALTVAILAGCAGGRGAPAPVAPSAAGASPSASPSAPVAVVVAFSEISPNDIPLWVAVDGGAFKQNGLAVDARLVESSLGVGALLSGEASFAAMGGSETLAAAVGGADLTVLAAIAGVYAYKLEVSPAIKTAQDLKGKKLGISRIGSSSDLGTRAVLKRLGLQADTDVQLVQIGSLAARVAALYSGALDGAVSGLPDNIELEAHGFHPLFDLAEQRLPSVNNVLVSPRAWVAVNKGTTQKLVDGLMAGIARTQKDKPFALEVMKKYFKDRGGDPKALEATYDFSAKEVFHLPPLTTMEQFQDSVDELAKREPKAKTFDLKRLIDNSFVENAVARGIGS